MTDKTGPDQRLDGLWLAYMNGLPLMNRDYSNKTFKTQEAAQKAIDEETEDRALKKVCRNRKNGETVEVPWDDL